MKIRTIDELNYLIKDATEAGHLAFDMGDEAGVMKYFHQVNSARNELRCRADAVTCFAVAHIINHGAFPKITGADINQQQTFVSTTI